MSEVAIQDEQITEDDLKKASDELLLFYSGDALSCFVDERWQDNFGNKAWQLMVLDEIRNREKEKNESL